MCGYFCIGFIDFMLKGKRLLEYANLFSADKHNKNDKIILEYFHKNLNKLKRWKCIAMFAINIENSKTLKCHIILKRRYIFLLFAVSVVMNIKKIFEEED